MFSRRTEWKLTPNRLAEEQRATIASGRDTLDLTVSNPTAAGLPYDADFILGSLADPESLNYEPQAKGRQATRRAVAEYYGRHQELNFDPEMLVLTASTSEGYSFVFRLLCNPGDEVLIPKPSYPLFDFLADLNDVRAVGYPLLYDHGWQIDFASLHRLLTPQTRAIVIVNPNNPTGSYVEGQQRAELGAFCRDFQLGLIVDEVFLDYALDGAVRPTFAGNTQCLTFTLSGLSKIAALPQMKLAWIATSGPERVRSEAIERLEVIADTYLSVGSPVQIAAPALLGHCEKLQATLVDRLRHNLQILDAKLAQQRYCSRLQVDGGWYAILRVPVLQSDEELAIRLLRETAVLVHPGHFYDFASDGYLVLSLITSPEIFHIGIQRVLDSVNDWAV